MDVRSALKSQYHAALNTLREAIQKAPDAIWKDTTDGFAAYWRVAYHTLYFAHFYLQQDQNSFTPWVGHRDEAQFMSNLPWENNRPPKSCEAYTRDDILEYWRVCDGMIDAGVDALDLSAPQCGFPWYQMPTLEHQIVNIRHIQHHAAVLSSRLRKSANIEVKWFSAG
jgi:hypothetical protein